MEHPFQKQLTSLRALIFKQFAALIRPNDVAHGGLFSGNISININILARVKLSNLIVHKHNHRVGENQCGSLSAGLIRSQQIWIYTVFIKVINFRKSKAHSADDF